MFIKILKSQWLSFRRSPTFGQSVGVKILLGFFAFYCLFIALGIGFGAHLLISEYFPDRDPVYVFGGYFVFYLIIDLVMRYMIQKYPIFDVHKYVNLNIEKKTIVKFLLFKSLFSFFNLLPLFVLIPFLLMTVFGKLTVGYAIAWLFILITLVLLNHFFSYWLHLKSIQKPILAYGILSSISLIVFLEYKGIVSLHEYLCIGIFYLSNSLIALIPICLLLILIFADYKILRTNAYIDEHSTAGFSQNTITIESSFLNKQGVVGKLINMEFNLIWRYKKAKTYLILSILLLPVVCSYYNSDSNYNIIILALFLTGFFMYNYALYLFSWNTNHLDFILTNNITLKSFIKARYILLAGSCVFNSLLALPLLIVVPNVALAGIALLMFNIGFMPYFFIWFSMHFSKKMNANASGLTNYEGTSAAHFLILIPIIIMPMLFYLPFGLTGFHNLGLISIAVIGSLGIIFRDWIIDRMTSSFKKYKYSLHHKFSN